MKSPEHMKPQGGRFNLTPMIDVVFLLIIFFIVSNNIIQQDNAVLVSLPASETGVLQREQQTKQLTVTIEKSGVLKVGTQIQDAVSLRQIMADCRRDWGEEAKMIIRSDRILPYGEVKPILQMAAELGILHVSFAVEPRNTLQHPVQER